jgi:hypothetical protein
LQAEQADADDRAVRQLFVDEGGEAVVCREGDTSRPIALKLAELRREMELSTAIERPIADGVPIVQAG